MAAPALQCVQEETPCPRSKSGPASTMAYEDHWFGPPWTTPETIVMIHGNSESSRAWTQWVPHLAGKYRVVRPDLPGFGASSAPTDYGFTAQGARRRHRPLPRCARHRALPPDRRQIWRLGLHAIRQRSAASAALALPVRLAGARQRHRQCRPDPRQGRAAMGGRDHAGAARQRGVRGADPMVGRRADGQDRAALGVRRLVGAHRHGRSTPACRASPRRR